MTSKNPAFDKLYKILKLEADTGYRDKAMIGGLSQFAARWQQEAGDGDDVKKIADILRTYSQLNPVDPRRMAINQIVQLLGLPPNAIKPTAAPPAEIAPEARIEPGAAIAGTPPEPAAGELTSIESAAPRRPTEKIEAKAIPAAPVVERKPIERPKPKPLPEARDEFGNRIGLESPVTVINGIGPAIAEKLERLGVKTIRDLLYLLPRRYDDFSNLRPINRLQYGDEVTIMGTVWDAGEKRVRGGAAIFQAILSDGSGTIQCTWFNPYVANQIKRGAQIVVSGKVNEFNGRLTFSSPEFELLDSELLNTARIVPVYPLTEGLSNRMLRKFTRRTVDYWSPRVVDELPDSVRNSAGLMSLPTALLQIHFPDSIPALETAQRRLAFDELFLLQLGLLRQKRQWRNENGRALPAAQDRARLETFIQALPYPLTEAQQRVIDEILNDIGSTHPMSRLVQGDVGSGKTVVAAAAMFLAAQSGAQAAIMAPTEILAEQHYKNLGRLFETVNGPDLPQPLTVRLLTGSTPQAERELILAEIADGRANIVVGTHALIQETVAFHDLALAVIDEQHRFGVAQRALLRQKGSNPHVLVMTATPIPRTLALTLYGDLDLSVIDQMPPGRQPIETRIVLPQERERAYAFVRAQIEKGRQAFIICPLVEESDKIEAKAAVEEHARLQKHVFPQFQLGLMHGRMKSEDKDAAMRAFANNETQILVSTSVVEVGIDVPNATLIMIEGAERFGLAQLHQFRGRVGRGEHKSFCLLQTELSASDITERLKAVEASTDGFVLAEKDLQLRGPGQFFGTRQSGLPDLHMTNVTDARLIDLARREADKVLTKDPELSAEEYQLLAQRLKEFWASGAGDLS
ncbi:ATP-dependent DNA helicase RecG [Thermoflexales bacterium]|nr:ATP-dependent DNA helicase RecG [Thermoflexales bacterium]